MGATLEETLAERVHGLPVCRHPPVDGGFDALWKGAIRREFDVVMV